MTDTTLETLIGLRRQLHQQPELGYQEVETSKLIASKLDDLGIPYTTRVARTGIVAEIQKGSGKCVALRADMDALPIREATGLDFASEKDGLMHACGHDLHTTMLLGAIMELQQCDFNGTIRFVFQPSEEGANGDPEKKSGGQRVVEEGTLEGVDYALALHVHPLLEVGHLSYALGDALACTSHFTITVLGKSGHAGAAPHLAKDAILSATALVQNLHTIVSRDINPTEAGVLSITTINGGVANNVIADKVEITGTLRALSMDNYRLIIRRMKDIIAGNARAFGTEIDLSIELFYPSVVNSEVVHQQLEETARRVFPKGISEVEPMLGGEDFAFYANAVPSMFYLLGAKDDSEECYFLHHPKVVFNEDCIRYGVAFLREAALKLLI